jgi:uncharacterized protein (TIGR03437 family)
MRIESKSIFAIVLVVMTLSLSSVPLLSAQQVTGIFSDADRSGMFPPRVAPGSIFLIGGFGLGPGVNASSSPLPYELGGTSVQVIVGERRVDAPMLFVSENWVRAILPAETPEGTAFVVLRRNGRESYPRDILVVRRELRLYGRSGWAMLAHNITPTGEWQANAYAQPARPGQLVAVWGTGLGVQQEVSSVEVLVGDKSVPALYAGPATCCVGMDVVVFEVPAGIEGCHVPVKMKFVTDGSETNSPLLAIASGEGACSDPHGLPTSLLEKFESTGILDTGIIAGTARDPGLVPTPEQESGKVGDGLGAFSGAVAEQQQRFRPWVHAKVSQGRSDL